MIAQEGRDRHAGPLVGDRLDVDACGSLKYLEV
jgi:hypothetical protein